MFKLIALLEVQAVAVRAFFKPRRAGKQGFSRRRIAGPALAAGRRTGGGHVGSRPKSSLQRRGGVPAAETPGIPRH